MASQEASLIGYLTIALVLGPMIAPAIAGFIAEISGWQHMFFLMLLVSLFTLSWLVKSLPETRWIGSTPQDRAQGFLDGLPLLKNRDFLVLSGTWAFGGGIYFSFLAGAAFVVIEEMGRSEIEYGAYFIGGGICFMFGNLLSARFSARIGLFPFIQYGTALAMVSVLTQWLLIGIEHPLIVFLPMYVVPLSPGWLAISSSTVLLL